MKSITLSATLMAVLFGLALGVSFVIFRETVSAISGSPSSESEYLSKAVESSPGCDMFVLPEPAPNERQYIVRKPDNSVHLLSVRYPETEAKSPMMQLLGPTIRIPDKPELEWLEPYESNILDYMKESNKKPHNMWPDSEATLTDQTETLTIKTP